jgi:hypothetical protein
MRSRLSRLVQRSRRSFPKRKSQVHHASPSSSCPSPNICGDPDQEYFVDGVTESLTTDLSRIAGSFVIGPQHGIYLQRQAHNVKQIGRELNVRYVLEGSIQRSSRSASQMLLPWAVASTRLMNCLCLTFAACRIDSSRPMTADARRRGPPNGSRFNRRFLIADCQIPETVCAMWREAALNFFWIW